MSTGDVVVRGRIKVDARKALHKLRDHMLVDLHLYATEMARAAVALGATRLDLDFDADEVMFAFDGRALALARIANVRDYVLGTETTNPDEEALRALGIGITAALGLDLAAIDVEIGRERLRFTKSYIEDAEGDALVAEPIKTSKAKVEWTTRIVVRRRLGLATIGRAVRGETPRELVLLANTIGDAPLAVFLRQKRLMLHRSPVLLRIDLDEPSATRAYLEIITALPEARAGTLWLEHGVMLAEVPGVDTWSLPLLASTGALPLRLVIDARQLPTNASRFAIQVDAELPRRIRARLPNALEVAVSALKSIVIDGKTPRSTGAKIGHHIEVIDASPERCEDALGALVAHVAQAKRAGIELPPPAAALLELPLLRDAHDRALTPTALLTLDPKTVIRVHAGKTPIPLELAPSLGTTVWRRGRACERMLDGLALAPVDELLHVAQEAHTRRSRALAHPATPPLLPTDASAYLLRESFEAAHGPFRGLRGEIGIVRTQGSLRRAATARLFVDDRLLDTIALSGVALPVDVALAWPGRIVARPAYDGVAPNEALTRALVYALRVAAIAVAERLRPRDREVVRLAIAAFVSATAALGDGAPSFTIGALAREALWPTTEPGVYASLTQLTSYIARTGALCVGARGAGRAPDGRPVLETSCLAEVGPLLAPGVTIVPYDRFLGRGASAAADAITREAVSLPIWVSISRENVSGIVGIGRASLRIHHTGALLFEGAYQARNGPVLVVVEDAAAVPTAQARGLTWRSGLDLSREEDALLEIVVERCERGELDVGLIASWIEEATRKVRARLDEATEDAAQRTWLETWWPRLVDLPHRAARERSLRLKNEILARPVAEPARVAVRIVAGTTATRTTPGFGSVTVTLPEGTIWSGPSPDLLYCGRLLSQVAVVELPLAIAIDVARDDFVQQWATLTEVGANWARAAIVDGALEVLRQRVEGDFANDVSAMSLAVALLARHASVATRLASILRAARWPTIQGGEKTIASGETVPFGDSVYASYRTPDRAEDPSPYDAPAAHIADDRIGKLRRELLSALGHPLRDVSDATARVQERRRRLWPGVAPKLSGEATSPLLRVTLPSIGVTLSEGELEIVAGDLGRVTRIDALGTAKEIRLTQRWPFRVVFRCDEAREADALVEIRAAAEGFFVALIQREADRLRELPPFVLELARAFVTHAPSLAGPLARLPVFVDTTDVARSLVELAAFPGLRLTTDPPPYPAFDGGAPILRLTSVEHKLLAGVIHAADITQVLRDERRGDERRNAPPLPLLELPPDVRARCLGTFRLEKGDVEGIHGEVGVLAPSQTSLRGIHVHVTMRALCTIVDEEGWPTVAVMEVDDAVPNRTFDGLVELGTEGRILRAIRVALSSRVTTFFTAPPDALGVVRLPLPLIARVTLEGGAASVSVPCIGILWLPRTWPERPELAVEAIGFRDPFRTARSPAGPGLSRTLPFCGRIYVACEHDLVDGAIAHVSAWARDRLPTIVQAAANAKVKKAPPESIAAYEWDLALAGLLGEKGDPRVELARDRPDPMLVHVAARRAPELLEGPTSTTPSANDGAVDEGVEPPKKDELAAFTSESFLDDLVRRIVELVSPPAPNERQEALVVDLSNALAAMKLTGQPVENVVGTRRGSRPLRYDAEKRSIVLNLNHASVKALGRDAVLYLLTAAVSEVNRELEAVTDAEELAIVRDLMRERVSRAE